MTTDLISIVMPVYNQGEFIQDAIVSIIQQTYTNWELIVIDDGSTDDSQLKVLSYMSDGRIRYTKKENGGTGSALNVGFSMASGKYETWFASDNVMYPNNLEMLVKGIEDCDHVYGDVYQVLMDDSGQVEVSRRLFSTAVPTMEYSYEELKRGYNLGICWLWRRELRLKCIERGSLPGRFQIEPCEDYDMALRMAEVGGRFKWIPDILGWQRQHNKNLTTTVVDETGNPNAKTHFVHQKANRRTSAGGMRIAIINLEFDCAGVGWNLKQAIEKYTNHKCKHVTGKLYPYASKTDLLMNLREDSTGVQELRKILEWADVLHFNQWMWNHNPSQHKSPFEWNSYKDTPITQFYPYFKRKKVLFHFHSGELLAAPGFYEEEARKVGAKILTCDPPSELCVKSASWIPNVLEFSNMPKARFPSGLALNVYSGHGQNDDRKNGALYKRYLDTVANSGYQVSFESINGIEKEQSFRKRQDFQIALESLTEGYIGMVGWEAMAMGQVVMARLAPSTVEKYATFGKPPPIINCDTVALMMKEVRDLYTNRSKLREAMIKSMHWMQKYYRPEKIVDMYIKTYEKM